MFFIDTHVHWTHDKLWPAHSLIEQANQDHIAYMMTICLSSKDLERGKELQSNYSSIGLAAALHPSDFYSNNLFWEEVICEAEKGTLSAIGETGIDLFHKNISLKEQKKRFILHLELALTCDLPVIIHARNALSNVLEILDHHYLLDSRARPGIIHCFDGNQEEYQEITKRGWLIGIGGCITFKRSNDLRECVRGLDPSSYVLETDAPYLSPEPNRKRLNHSGHLPEIANFIATIRGETIQKISEDTSRNAIALFDLKSSSLKGKL